MCDVFTSFEKEAWGVGQQSRGFFFTNLWIILYLFIWFWPHIIQISTRTILECLDLWKIPMVEIIQDYVSSKSVWQLYFTVSFPPKVKNWKRLQNNYLIFNWYFITEHISVQFLSRYDRYNLYCNNYNKNIL